MSTIVPGYIPTLSPERLARAAARIALRQRLAAALDPALIEAAHRVRDALSERYDASLGTDEYAHVVVLRGVTSADMAKVDAITQKAATPMWGDARHFQSFITITIKTGRAVEMEARYLARHGDGGMLFAPGKDGPLTQYGTLEARPVVAGGYDDE